MTPAERATIRAISTHGLACTYSKVASVYDVETSVATKTLTSYSTKAYKQHLKATQFHYPSLISKDAALFLLSGFELGFTPEVEDQIQQGSDIYKVQQIQEHSAYGGVFLYKLACVK